MGNEGVERFFAEWNKLKQKGERKKRNERVSRAFGELIGGFIRVFIIMWLWNLLVPDILHLREIGYWEAFGLWVLCTGLFFPVLVRTHTVKEGDEWL